MQLIDQTTDTVISTNARVADTFWSRFIGLMFKKSIGVEDALIIDPCNNVHMFFMNFPIDVLFIDEEDTICCIQENLRQGQISKYVAKARYVVELPSGRMKEKNVKIGDKIHKND
ncbi:MAG TPA: DUF192 domain-containing protein [Clostridiales bacterium]|nr:MAG: hypothetical protein A2Y18_00215 [Clostridiales bacterium GWD2_32_19]HCC06932.1 DUF192 domain-containing protein [Clostridiales bacterium]